MTIAEKLKIIQSLSGLTQEKLAKKLGVSFVTFNSWINKRSKPHRKSEGNINNLYFKYTGQKIVPDDPLSAKKQIILRKSKEHKNILREIVKSPDIYDQFMLSFTYHTNRIEGNTLTEDETKAILFDNVALSNKNIIEQLEVKNHQTAWRYLLDCLTKSAFSISENLILKLHGILINSIKDDAGSYRKHQVRIVGSYVPTANYLKVSQSMKKIVKDINRQNKDIISQIAKTHSQFEQVHPFSDGNGRIGRLIIQGTLLLKNFPPAIIKQDKKRLYNSYLKKSQLKEDFVPLEDFICDSVLEGFKILERF